MLTMKTYKTRPNDTDLFARLNNIGFSNNDIENMANYLENNPGVIDQIKPIFTQFSKKFFITCVKCKHRWNYYDSKPQDAFICHLCHTDNSYLYKNVQD